MYKRNFEKLYVGQILTNEEVARLIDMKSIMKGINYRSGNPKEIIIISSSKNGTYKDPIINGVLHYTGEGQKGNHSVERRGNYYLSISREKRIGVFLFLKKDNNKYEFKGEVVLADAHYFTDEPDRDGEIRKVVRFPFKQKESHDRDLISFDEYKREQERKERLARKKSLTEIKKNAIAAQSEATPVTVTTTVYERDPYVAEYVKERANGKCDLCGEDAPFIKKDGTPYLESHHVITLSEKGPDTIYNTVALCPNCHRKIHSLNDPEDQELLADILLKHLLEENEKELVDCYNELFKNEKNS